MAPLIKKAWQHSVLDKPQTDRFKKLGDLGEYLAEELLKEHRFIRVRNLNEEKQNNAFADIYAIRQNTAYVLSVKTRNKYEHTGRLNSRYKLGSRCYELAPQAERVYRARAAWIAIAIDIDRGTLDAYWGLLSDLGGNKGIPMTQEATRGYSCLAQNKSLEDFGISHYKHLKNVYKVRS